MSHGLLTRAKLAREDADSPSAFASIPIPPPRNRRLVRGDNNEKHPKALAAAKAANAQGKPPAASSRQPLRRAVPTHPPALPPTPTLPLDGQSSDEDEVALDTKNAARKRPASPPPSSSSDSDSSSDDDVDPGKNFPLPL
jgi:hypothetical protein